jgi:hypothetical protein
MTGALAKAPLNNDYLSFAALQQAGDEQAIRDYIIDKKFADTIRKLREDPTNYIAVIESTDNEEDVYAFLTVFLGNDWKKLIHNVSCLFLPVPINTPGSGTEHLINMAKVRVESMHSVIFAKPNIMRIFHQAEFFEKSSTQPFTPIENNIPATPKLSGEAETPQPLPQQNAMANTMFFATPSSLSSSPIASGEPASQADLAHLRTLSHNQYRTQPLPHEIQRQTPKGGCSFCTIS